MPLDEHFVPLAWLALIQYAVNCRSGQNPLWSVIVVNVEYKERAGDGSRGQRASRFLRPLQQISCFPNPRASSARLLAAASYSLEQAAGRGATGATCQLLTHRLSLYVLIPAPPKLNWTWRKKQFPRPTYFSRFQTPQTPPPADRLREHRDLLYHQLFVSNLVINSIFISEGTLHMGAMWSAPSK